MVRHCHRPNIDAGGTTVPSYPQHCAHSTTQLSDLVWMGVGTPCHKSALRGVLVYDAKKSFQTEWQTAARDWSASAGSSAMACVTNRMMKLRRSKGMHVGNSPSCFRSAKICSNGQAWIALTLDWNHISESSRARRLISSHGNSPSDATFRMEGTKRVNASWPTPLLTSV